MNGWCKSLEGNYDKVIEIANKVFNGKESYFIAQRVEKIEFGKGLPVGIWASGRIFGQESEIRWEKIGENKFRILILSENLLDEFKEGAVEYDVSEGMKLYLWGNKKPNTKHFIEVRIPKPLNYPVKGTGNTAFIKALPYRQKGVTIFLRFKEVGDEVRETT